MADESRPRCTCARCRVRGLMGPVIVIAIGALFLIGEYTRFSFGDLWPLLLIVIGAMLLVQSLASSEGHTGS